MLKKFLLSIVLLGGIIGISNAAQIFLDPQFSDTRFEPADKFHAGCINTINVQLKTSKEDINSLRLILSYEPEKIQIIDIKPTDTYKNILDSKIEYDKVIVTLLDANIPNNDTTKLFTLSFKSADGVSGSLLAIHKPSYVMSKTSTKTPIFVEQSLQFAQVPECEPDTIPPTIMLSKPKDTSIPLALDSYFVFTIKDLGKGIDKNSLQIRFNGKTYSGNNPAFSWQNEYLAFLPQDWIPLSTGITLQIKISDKQVYGGPNTIKKSFSFVSASGVSFEHVFTPTMFRSVIGKVESIFASPTECKTLALLASKSYASALQIPIFSLAEKVGCTLDTKILTQQAQQSEKVIKSAVFISVFSAIGWVLFIISFLLKLHYFSFYKKHKNTIKSLQSSQSKH